MTPPRSCNIKDIGIRIALDDSGNRVLLPESPARFPINTIKIDRSFVQEFGTAPDSTASDAVLRLAEISHDQHGRD